KFLEWEKTVIKSFKKNPEAANLVMQSTMKAQLVDEPLSKCLAPDATKKVSSTSAIEAKPDIVLVSQWIGEKKTGIEAFNLLKLDEAETSIFQTPAFHTWAQYATEMRKTRSPKVALGITLAILKKRFDEVDLAKMLLVAKHTAAHDVDRNILSELQRLLFKSWRARGEDFEAVAKRLMFTTGTDERTVSVVADYNNFLHG
ncbi:hypothetical protein PHYSODRAFT_515345, partial [Phytophthora sojae]